MILPQTYAFWQKYKRTAEAPASAVCLGYPTWYDISCPNKFYDELKEIFASVIVYDVISHEGIEQSLDLNFPLPIYKCQTADLVIDPGTLEHCFNVGQAFQNMCELVRVGGSLITTAPFIMPNHAFWSFNPCVYFDAFEQNGFELWGFEVVTLNKPTWLPKSRFTPAIPDTIFIVAAKKTTHQRWKWPTQSAKYAPK